MATLELTLVVAATRNMGIGAHGGMPWKGLRKEMQYFARVTSRVEPQAPPGAVNAVIMGRKTWESIPTKFRPLKDRLNIVISRSADGAVPSTTALTEPVRVPSFEKAVQFAETHPSIARVFVMGGGQIYDAAARSPLARRVLFTSLDAEYDCDTYFPIKLQGGEGETTTDGWKRSSREELQSWTGETIPESGMEEAGVKYEWQMWERK